MVQGLVANLRERGINLNIEGDRIKYWPKRLLTHGDLDLLRQHKADVLGLLKREAKDGETVTFSSSIRSIPTPGTVVGVCSLWGSPSILRRKMVGSSKEWLAWCKTPDCSRANLLTVEEFANTDRF